MPEFQVLKCFSCSTFQVQQAKKAGKFKCTMCGTNQTLQKIYAVSSDARDCRQVCMRLNEVRGEEGETTVAAETCMADHEDHGFTRQAATESSRSRQAPSTDWQRYLDDDEDDAQDNEEGEGEGQEGTGGFTTSVDHILAAKGRGRGRGPHAEERAGDKRQKRIQMADPASEEEEDRRRMPPPPIPHPRSALAPIAVTQFHQVPVRQEVRGVIFKTKMAAPKVGGKWAAYVDEEEELVEIDN